MNKKASLELYSWFLVFTATAIFIIALVALYLKLTSSEFVPLGMRASKMQSMFIERDYNLAILNELVKQSAYNSVLELASKGGTNRKIAGMLYYNDIPILIENDIFLFKINKEQRNKMFVETFLNYFYNDYDEFVKNANYMYNFTTYNKNLGNNIASSFELKDRFEYNNESVFLVNGSTLYGYALKNYYIRHTFYSSKKDILGNAELVYSPDFVFKFQNYSLDDFDDVISYVKAIYPYIKEHFCESEKDRINLLNEDLENMPLIYSGQKRYNVHFDKECSAKYQKDSFFKQYQSISLYNFEPCTVIICLEDKYRLISGKDENGNLLIAHPVYNFALRNNKNLIFPRIT